MKKVIAVVVISLLAVGALATVVMAAPGDRMGYCFNQANLTEAQKQEVAPLMNQMNDLHKQMFEVRKQMLQKQVEFGNLTQEQANQRIQQMNERMEKGFGPGMGMRHGHKGQGRGMMNGGPANCPYNQ